MDVQQQSDGKLSPKSLTTSNQEDDLVLNFSFGNNENSVCLNIESDQLPPLSRRRKSGQVKMRASSLGKAIDKDQFISYQNCFVSLEHDSAPRKPTSISPTALSPGFSPTGSQGMNLSPPGTPRHGSLKHSPPRKLSASSSNSKQNKNNAGQGAAAIDEEEDTMPQTFFVVLLLLLNLWLSARDIIDFKNVSNARKIIVVLYTLCGGTQLWKIILGAHSRQKVQQGELDSALILSLYVNMLSFVGTNPFMEPFVERNKQAATVTVQLIWAVMAASMVAKSRLLMKWYIIGSAVLVGMIGSANLSSKWSSVGADVWSYVFLVSLTTGSSVLIATFVWSQQGINPFTADTTCSSQELTRTIDSLSSEGLLMLKDKRPWIANSLLFQMLGFDVDEQEREVQLNRICRYQLISPQQGGATQSIIKVIETMKAGSSRIYKLEILDSAAKFYKMKVSDEQQRWFEIKHNENCIVFKDCTEVIAKTKARQEDNTKLKITQSLVCEISKASEQSLLLLNKLKDSYLPLEEDDLVTDCSLKEALNFSHKAVLLARSAKDFRAPIKYESVPLTISDTIEDWAAIMEAAGDPIEKTLSSFELEDRLSEGFEILGQPLQLQQLLTSIMLTYKSNKAEGGPHVPAFNFKLQRSSGDFTLDITISIKNSKVKLMLVEAILKTLGGSLTVNEQSHVFSVPFTSRRRLDTDLNISISNSSGDRSPRFDISPNMSILDLQLMSGSRNCSRRGRGQEVTQSNFKRIQFHLKQQSLELANSGVELK